MALYVRLSELFNELTRRASPTLVGQLEPHFNVLWKSVWPVLQWTFPTTDTGMAARRLLSQLCTFANYSEDGGPLD